MTMCCSPFGLPIFLRYNLHVMMTGRTYRKRQFPSPTVLLAYNPIVLSYIRHRFDMDPTEVEQKQTQSALESTPYPHNIETSEDDPSVIIELGCATEEGRERLPGLRAPSRSSPGRLP
jgi:hypothetical protein